jgi:Tol biopolymer transport system component
VVLDDSGDPWNPGICCKYNGVWALMEDANGGSLHVGGEFTQMGGTWSGSGLSWTLRGRLAQDDYGRLSDVAPGHPLTVSLDGTGSGSVTSTPAGIACPGTCATLVPDGTRVTLAATPAADSTFAGWGGDCVGTSDCVLVMDQSRQVTATFGPSRSGPVCGKLAFVSDRDGNDEIYTMNDDGSELTRITTDPATDASPSWSPDCAQIVFASQRTGRWNLYVVGADGTGEHAITAETEWDDRQPAWSPTGASIAFVSNRFGQNDLFTMSLDGSVLTRVTKNPGWDRDPAWGPNGTRIAFDSDRSGVFQIYTIGADGTQIANLTDGLTPSRQPAWSRGGAKIAFIGTSTGPAQVWLMDRDGSDPGMITDDPGTAAHPSWSFWGGRLAYAARDAGGETEVAIVGSDGTGRRGASDEPLQGSDPEWS